MLIDLIIPTLWKHDSFYKNYLDEYISYTEINNIIIIDNDITNRPNIDLLEDNKIKLLNYGSNIYVGPAWNKGVEFSATEIVCLLNDDIFVTRDVFTFVSKLDFKDIDIIGNNHWANNDEIDLVKLNHNKAIPLGEQCYGFGSCMFVKKDKYTTIPNNFQLLFTDDFLVHNCNNVYTLNTNKITGLMSTSLNALSKDEALLKRMSDDIMNGRDLLLR